MGIELTLISCNVLQNHGSECLKVYRLRVLEGVRSQSTFYPNAMILQTIGL